MQIHFTCSLSPEDWVQAFRLHRRPRPALKILGMVFALYCGVVFAWAVAGALRGDVIWTVLAIILGLCCAGWFWTSRFRIPGLARRLHAHQKTWHGLMRFLVDDAGVQLHTDCLNQSQPWSHFVRWKENGHLFLLYESDLVFSLVFPKRCMDPQTIEGLRGVLSTKVSPGA